MPGPTVTFAFVVATLIGALFHVVVGGDARRFALFLLAAWFGFVMGHLLAAGIGFGLFVIGPLQMGGALVGALVALLIVRYLTANRRQLRRNPRIR